MVKKVHFLISILCLICLATTPILFSNNILRLFWIYPEKYDIEIINNFVYTVSFVFFPIYFIYQFIRKRKGLSDIRIYKTLKICLAIFIVEFLLLVFYFYLLTRAVHQ